MTNIFVKLGFREDIALGKHCTISKFKIEPNKRKVHLQHDRLLSIYRKEIHNKIVLFVLILRKILVH